ncbi:MAG: GGDEF domain-containing protein [Fibrobacter sp.]|jgi:diguanylate cyclase (GGDEF)-like protein|nr:MULTISPECIES: GGDEF domain-containing protein [unclassified Fibrobacter]MBO6135758.1 GGDEF domain-containing protein [Fibrobacter sp.]MBQ3721721.1 GGDEF domain-containing protein [Fibrobacter sp.]MBR2058767.1 GGDEF domain-containing protein [Fibrobacter sp.]MBR2307652.1 GGDEF domain-containing protein [Fibrobacter sp.]MBR4007616.1 GGDEF domain-containing protein [Fibrobacter sp.]
MQMSIILFVVAGFLLGLSLQGGMFLFLIPFAGVAAALGYMNLPRIPGGKTASLPVVGSAVRATGITPAVTPELKNSFGDSETDYNEPGSTLRVNQVWARADADVKKAFGDMLEGLKRIVPNVHSLVVFSPLNSMKEWGIRAYACSNPEAKIATDVKITENTGLISQLFRLDVNRLLEGDLSGGKPLLYYIDNPMIKSVVAVPMLDRGKNRVGAVVMDSLYPSAFNQHTAQALTYIASTLYTLYFKSFVSAKNYIEQQQFSVLYHYQHQFFKNMSVKEIYRQISEYVKGNIPFDRMMILALDRQNDYNLHQERTGRVVSCYGIDADQFENKTFTLSDKGLAILALYHNRPVERTFNQSAFNAYIPRIDSQEKKNMDIRQLFVMPVPSDANAEQAELAICLESRRSDRYSEHEMNLLKAFAGVAGFAYARACQVERDKDLATRDGLTGLINHRTLHENLRTEKIRADRQKYNIGVLMMDIDHFKNVNDTYGHPIGDVVIKGIAGAISGEIRKEIDIVARYGGEEFVVGLVDTTPEGMIETAERIRHAVMKLEFDVHQQDPLRVTVSIGAFLVTPDFHDMKKAVTYADQALYKAKEGGRNQVIQYTDKTAEHVAVEQGV